MAALSRFLFATNYQKLSPTNGLLQKLLPKNNSYMFQTQNGNRRWMSEHHVMEITASRWQWHKTKDWFHFYFLLGAIPAFALIIGTNVFIGPATLEPIPEGYNPQPWEYHKHPISRFLARYYLSNPQMDYEKYLAKAHKVWTKKRITELEKNIRMHMSVYNDYKYFSYKRGTVQQIIDIRKRIDENDIAV